jgi:hypothetical protein
MNASHHRDTLYQIVPVVYRNRDSGDLKKYFQACGLLLDQIHHTLKQRMTDNFPDNPIDGSAACQEWLLPYFADLLDVRLVSPSVKGRRDEVANAVRWRQGKGTLQVIEDIAEAVGRLEVVLQEGWKRVAVTPRLNTPRIPATHFGYADDAPATPPSMAARHPGLPAATVDFRCPSGAVAATTSNPAAQQSTVDGDTHVWRQASYHGAPCYPNSYEDVSRRTVDFRAPDWRRGHFHPERVLLYTVPPAGFFKPNLPVVNWSNTEDFSDAFLDLIEIKKEDDNVTTYRNKSFGTEHFVPVRVRGVIQLGQTASGTGDADAHRWRFEGLIFDNRVELDAGRLQLDTCAVRIRVEVHSADRDEPVIEARHCLLQSVQVARGLARLEYCTVLQTTLTEAIQASDCIFLGRIRNDLGASTAPDRGCVRYSRVRKDQAPGGMQFSFITHKRPVMYSTTIAVSSVAADRGCGVLHPATPEAIRHGAEDGAEMGAYHQDHFSLLAEAMVDKLADYLPVGLQAVIIPDQRLLSMPG